MNKEKVLKLIEVKEQRKAELLKQVQASSSNSELDRLQSELESTEEEIRSIKHLE